MAVPAKLNLRLLGPARIEKPQVVATEGKRVDIPRFRSRRTVALLGYLVAERRPVSRDFLARLFWPDEARSRGRGSLRRDLHNLARILPGCWVLNRQVVAFEPADEVEVDAYSLLELQGEERWQEAADLLEGEFLEGLYLADNPEFESWLLAQRERWLALAETILSRVIDGQIRRGRYSGALHYARRLLQLSPWKEEIHRQVMRLLAWTGQRAAALRHYESCKQALWEELNVEPAAETMALYQQIYEGELDLPPQLPAFLTEERARHNFERPPFVARERELAQLDTYLGKALAGQGQVVFVTGGPGRGKTALLEAFARRAMADHPDLLVANGNCIAYSGVGDPYLPFRDVMAMLVGDVEAKWHAGAISRDHACRLWYAMPLVVARLLDLGPHLLDVLVSSATLLSQAALPGQAPASYLPRLREQANRQQASLGDIEQSYLFQQVTNFLLAVAEEHPLLLVLDDLQWVDTASIGLLFHLGRRLAEAAVRVLIICAYRPEEVGLGHNGERHPLAKALSEIKRTFGDLSINLGPAMSTQGREFVDALVDSQPNRLAEDFRSTLFKRTAGHPLFTIELLRAMQQRGDLLKDDHGYWIEGPRLDWSILPARVEAVIKERIDRLDQEPQEMLAIACVEGEVFTAQVVAHVHQRGERSTLRTLSRELESRHKLVREQEEIQTRNGTLSRYKFGHVLFQEYIYKKRLSSGERRLLHGDVASALEKLFEGEVEEIVLQLGHHFSEARDYNRALPYFIEAADRAARIHANDEAVAHYTRALELADKVTLVDAPSQAELHHRRGLACQKLGDFDCARSDLETAMAMAHEAGESRLAWRLLLDLGKLWASRDYQRTHNYFEQALELARRMDDALVLGRTLNWMGNWHANAENPVRAAEYQQEALEIFQDLGDRQGLAITLDLLGNANLLGGDLSASVGYYDLAIALFQEMDDSPRLVSSLMGRGTTVSISILLATAPPSDPPDALEDIKEALRIAREIHAPSEEAWASWSLGLLHTARGRFGAALEVASEGLRIATELGHREWTVGNRFALGVVYVELLAPNEARIHLEEALSQAQGLRSQYWINHVAGALAAVYFLLDDLIGAQRAIETAISSQTAMDTMGKRYCWARRAELALLHGDPALALEIVERLIASALGMAAGGVITFLWQLKGDALAAMGRVDEAIQLLQAALANGLALDERYLLWRGHASLGRLYRKMNRPEEAQEQFSTAHELVKELAATVPDETLQDNFRQRAYDTLGSS